MIRDDHRKPLAHYGAPQGRARSRLAPPSYTTSRDATLVYLEGAPTDIRAFPTWFTWSPMADSVRAALAHLVAPERSKEVIRD